MLAREIAQLCENYGIGKFASATGTDRTIFIGELPQTVNEGIFIIESASPPPHQYIATEYPILDFWSRSPETDRAHNLLELVYTNFHRASGRRTANWEIFYSHALGSIVDADRDAEGGKLYRLSVQFICRNLNVVN